MINCWGKFLGAWFGYLLAGFVGAIIGIIIGDIFDRGLKLNWYQQHFGYNSATLSKIQKGFFTATFLIMGHIAKSDGRVSENEIQAARQIMQRMGLSETLKQEAIALFTQGKQPDFNLQQALQSLINECRHNRGLLQAFFDIQLQAAYAGNHYLSPSKKQLLTMISQFLGVYSPNFAYFDYVYGDNSSQYNQGQYNSTTRTTPQSKLKDAYLLLEIPETASNAEVKRAYRRQMSLNHPDKLIAKGLPEEMLKLATEKTQKVKAAYEQICLARGI